MAIYDFKNLSSLDFELMTRDLLQEEFGVHLESFSSGRDSGIDFRYSIPTKSSEFIVQCKHYANSTFANLISTLKESEFEKIRKLNPTRYILVTSIGLTPANKQTVLETLSPFCIKPSDIYSREDINNLLTKYPQIEKRHFKLWITSTQVLERIINSDVFNRSTIELDSIRKKLRLYVQSNSFFEASELLSNKHCCVIAGIPGIGKTTLAEIALVDHVAKGYEAIKISGDISEAYKVYNADTRQIFFYDDFLGQTGLRQKLNKNEDQDLLRFIEAVLEGKNARFLLTTREYILKQAQSTYEKLDSPKITLTKYVLDLGKYTRYDRAKILFNHLYFSNLPKEYIQSIFFSRGYLKIIDHKNYSPRLIEWMTQTIDTSVINADNYLQEFLKNLDNPYRVWEHAFENQISSAAKALLCILWTMPVPALLEDVEQAFLAGRAELEKLFGNPRANIDFKLAIKEMDGAFIITNQTYSRTLVAFHNPSIKDFLDNYLTSDQTLIKALCGVAEYFDQPHEIYLSILNRRKKPSQELKTTLVATMMNLIGNQGCGYSLHYDVKDRQMILARNDVPEKRILDTIGAIQEFEEESAVEKIEKLLTFYISNYRNEVKSKGRLADLFQVALSYNINDKLKANLVATCDDAILSVGSSIHDYTVALNYVNALQTETGDIGSRKLTLVDLFTQYCENDAIGEAESMGEPHLIYSHASDIETLGAELDVDITEVAERVQSIASELEDKISSYEPDKMGERDEENKDSSDEAITDMFNALME